MTSNKTCTILMDQLLMYISVYNNCNNYYIFTNEFGNEDYLFLNNNNGNIYQLSALAKIRHTFHNRVIIIVIQMHVKYLKFP